MTGRAIRCSDRLFVVKRLWVCVQQSRPQAHKLFPNLVWLNQEVPRLTTVFAWTIMSEQSVIYTQAYGTHT